MKKMLCFILISCIHFAAYCQISKTIFFDKDYVPVNKRNASIIRVAKVEKGLYQVDDRLMNGKKLMKGSYISITPLIEHGLFTYYNQSGDIYASGSFNMGDMSGNWVYSRNEENLAINYDTVADELKKSQGLMFRNIFTDVSIPQKLSAFLERNLFYPPRLLYSHDTSELYISFIQEEGIILPVLMGTHRDYETEAMRGIMLARDSMIFETDSFPVNLAFKIIFKPGNIKVTNIDGFDTFFSDVEEVARFEGRKRNRFNKWAMASLSSFYVSMKRPPVGEITMQFVVNTDGKVDYVKILNGSGNKILDQEAIDTISASPDWIPAKVQGKSVNQIFVFKISFQG